MANEFFLLTWYEQEQIVLVEGFLGIWGAVLVNILSKLGMKESMWCCGKTEVRVQLTAEKTQSDRTDQNEEHKFIISNLAIPKASYIYTQCPVILDATAGDVQLKVSWNATRATAY